MVKNRKPLFVSEKAWEILKRKAEVNRRFMGDEVDIWLGLKTEEQVREENKLYFKETTNDLYNRGSVLAYQE